MAQQNIYDNEAFFEGYSKLRERDNNANILFEMPALFSMLPDLQGKTVLDLGCGFGEHCMYFVKMGAAKVVGVDISEKMLRVARKENNAPNIVYLRMAMEHISELDEYFDLVVSSLAFHYVEDFESLIKDCYDLLKPGGTLLFSQEHPLASCYGVLCGAKQCGEASKSCNEDRSVNAVQNVGAGQDNCLERDCPASRWTRDENGRKLYVNLANYAVEGERESTWFVDGVKKYHRTFSTIVNALADAGFVLEHVIEPTPTEEILAKHPEQADLFHKPDFLIVKAKKGL